MTSRNRSWVSGPGRFDTLLLEDDQSWFSVCRRSRSADSDRRSTLQQQTGWLAAARHEFPPPRNLSHARPPPSVKQSVESLVLIVRQASPPGPSAVQNAPRTLINEVCSVMAEPPPPARSSGSSPVPSAAFADRPGDLGRSTGRRRSGNARRCRGLDAVPSPSAAAHWAITTNVRRRTRPDRSRWPARQ